MTMLSMSTCIGSRSEFSENARVLPSAETAKSSVATLMPSEIWGNVAFT